MYTECPECNTAFRVTAKILQQADSQVRCGGCGHVFSAIDYLTEDAPGPHNPGTNPADTSEDAQTTDDILAETHKQLLETLDELTGPEHVRIEDTGTEWRVLDDADESGQTSAAGAAQESVGLAVVTQVPPDEQRYDDNTPFAENFDGNKKYQHTPRLVPPRHGVSDFENQGASEFNETQADIALSKAEDWTELLDEISEGGTETDDIPLEVEEELAAIHDEAFAAEAAPTEAGLPEPDEDELTINQLFDEDSADVETIIMEGEVIHGSLERERLKAENVARIRFGTDESLPDTDVDDRGMRGGRRATDPASYGVIAGTILLALLLVGQITHAYRETLSTYGFFNQTIGPVYRLLGNPVTPEWNIKDWRFEATNGNIAEDEGVLTIFSSISNNSMLPLPYPLVHVSLTDRWEEIIGSRVLMPNEYLAGDLDPSKPVIPGENFNAVITIDEPSADATGFRLNVCYRVSPGRVRCATEDFKD